MGKKPIHTGGDLPNQTSMCSSLTAHSGCSYLYSQTCADIQFCKRSGNINTEEHRTICVSKIHSNTNFKLIGEQGVWNSERAKVFTGVNLGGRKGMCTVGVGMNQCLLCDLNRAKPGQAAVMSNDAWGCYDCITHIAILLALQCLGVTCPPILAFLLSRSPQEFSKAMVRDRRGGLPSAPS